jgi:hypothetical protein
MSPPNHQRRFPILAITNFGIFGNLFILAVLSILLTSCGTPGRPLPPSLNIPRPVHDLQAARKSDVVLLSWTSPQQTTDGALLSKPGKIIVRRATGENQTPVVIRELPLTPASKSAQGQVTFKESLAGLIASGSGDFATYTIEATNSLGRSDGISNRVVVPLVATPTPPEGVQVKLVPEGVSVTWKQDWPPQPPSRLKAQYAYLIKRRLEGANKPVTVTRIFAGNAATLFVDSGIEWEKQYQYWITPVTLWQSDAGEKGEVEGDDSPIVTIAAHDVFPPAVPAGVQAVFSGSVQNLFIDLTWTANSEADLAGYNVYRHIAGGPPEKVNTELVKTSSFRDSNVRAGTKYFYAVSAVDQRGNESGKSEETSEQVP